MSSSLVPAWLVRRNFARRHKLPNINLSSPPGRLILSLLVKTNACKQEQLMSTASKLTLAGTTLGAVGIVFFVHYAQKAEQAAMHAGVLRDVEQQRLKKERQLDFDMQRQLEEEYRKIQHVRTETNRNTSSTT